MGNTARDKPTDARLASDVALIERIQAREEESFEILLERHGRSIYALADRLTGDPEAAWDVFQHTAESIWIGARTYRPEVGSAGAWLLAITANCARQYLRDNPRTVRLESGLDIAQTSADPLKTLELQDALARLPTKYRDALVMKYIGEISVADIAEIMDISAKAAESLLRRARLRLARELREDD